MQKYVVTTPTQLRKILTKLERDYKLLKVDLSSNVYLDLDAVSDFEYKILESVEDKPVVKKSFWDFFGKRKSITHD